MVTDSAQHRPRPPRGVFVRLGDQVRQFICGLNGHDSLLHFEPGRVSLLCSSCGYETPGWDVKSAPQRREPGRLKRRAVRMRLVGARRIA